MTAPLTSPPAATASPDPVDVAVIGAGQAGLAAGYFLARAARDVDRGRR
ncbi:NAD(P)/FAD-dependent oxidoreductase, partial [Micrococcus luteus]|nr:NAD(P)/FAD-dependent oxidoreductase [Micrococcus luteus]